MLTAIPRGGALQGAVPLHQRQLGVYSAQGMEAFEANEVSDDDELEAEDQKAVASTTILQQREQKLPCAQGRQPEPLERWSPLSGQSDRGSVGREAPASWWASSARSVVCLGLPPQ